ncbi:MAG: VanZ family protein [Oscillospiraceae bacterium]|nr:VanZ family protein [Oscillospiraceae bacterium]
MIWFYCLDMPEALALILCATGVFLWLRARFGGRSVWKPTVFCLLVLWLVLVLSMTIVRRESALRQENSLIPFYSYYSVLRGANKELIRSNLMNVLLFYPAGLLLGALLPEGWKPWKRVLLAAAAALTLSFLIEMAQYCFRLGIAETDDVIHNTLGAFLGALALGLPLELKRE